MIDIISKCLLLCIFIAAGTAQCPQRNGLYGIQTYCDRYVECKNGTYREQLCPDGLVFDDRRNNLRYPCDYPSDVDCSNRPQRQQAQPTLHCPHKYGMFPDEDQRNCGAFWSCVDGRAFQFNCPEGLAFSVVTNRCEYPDEAPNCNAEVFLGFRCPPVDPEIFRLFLGNPRYPNVIDCKKFFVCIDGVKPRLQSCPNKQVFNSNLGACDDPINVPGCESYYGEESIDVRTNVAG